MWNIFFFKIPWFTICFSIFFIIFGIFFNFVYLYFSKISGNFYVFLFYGLEILSKIFVKSWNVFLKNIDIWNPKFFINSIIYYLFFLFFLAFFMSFFSISPNQTCQKNLNIFVVLYYTDYRFYHKILENSWILIKKIKS